MKKEEEQEDFSQFRIDLNKEKRLNPLENTVDYGDFITKTLFGGKEEENKIKKSTSDKIKAFLSKNI